MDRESLFRSLAFILGVVLVLELAWGSYKAIVISRTDLSVVDAIETLDTDATLGNTIDSLEANWQHRRNYRFTVDQDPLYLGRVVNGFTYGAQGYQESDEGGVPRLSATLNVINDRPMAIIKYGGKSYVVKEGDTFGDGYTVNDIQRQQVIIRKNGNTITLQNTPIGGAVDDENGRTDRSQEW